MLEQLKPESFQEKFESRYFFIYDFAEKQILNAFGIFPISEQFAVIEGKMIKNNRVTILVPDKKAKNSIYVMGLLYEIEEGQESVIGNMDNWYANSKKKFNKNCKFDLTVRTLRKVFPLMYNSKYDIMDGTYQTNSGINSYVWVYNSLNREPLKTGKRFDDGCLEPIKQRVREMKGEV